jgi:hypothetical protein
LLLAAKQSQLAAPSDVSEQGYIDEDHFLKYVLILFANSIIHFR